MSKQTGRVDAYLEELSRELGLGSDMTDVLDEVRDHLQEAATSKQRGGVREDAAMEAAVREFGKPGMVAAGLRPVIAQLHTRRLAWRLLRGTAALASGGVLGFLLLTLWLGTVPDHTRADPIGINAGVTAARLLGGATLLMFVLSHRRWLWTGPRRARRLLALCVGAEWLLTLAWLVCPAIVGARLAVVFALPAAALWSAAAAVGGAAAAFKLTKPMTGTRLLLAG
jgi:hypothetical protein